MTEEKKLKSSKKEPKLRAVGIPTRTYVRLRGLAKEFELPMYKIADVIIKETINSTDRSAHALRRLLKIKNRKMQKLNANLKYIGRKLHGHDKTRIGRIPNQKLVSERKE